ncbi:unnamed protein product [Linum trigynum]|uniref:Uncharacterized protein n=1 Tax=Linum trigynum TaxID=586398 RepID=A0AAV2EDW6_9ROSI
MGHQNREEQENQGRQRGRYREEMGARNLSLELERPVAAMEGSLRLEEERSQGSAGQTGTKEETVETGLTLGPTQQVGGAGGAQSLGNLGPTDIYLYQHQQEALEEEMGCRQKKRKGTGLKSRDRPSSGKNELAEIPYGPAEMVFMGGPGEKNNKKKNKKYRAHSINSAREGISEEEQGRDTRAAVVRQKLPLRE